MRVEWMLARRYLGGLRRSHPFVSVIALISVLGIALGVTALITVLGVMAGFDADLEGRIVGSNPHLIVQAEGGIREPVLLMERIAETPGVRAAAPFLQTQALLKKGQEGFGVILRGVDPAREPEVTGLPKALEQGAWPPAADEVIVGRELAARWGLSLGDRLKLVTGERAREHPLRVGGIFATGMYDYDLHLVLTRLSTAREVTGVEFHASGVGVRIERALRAGKMKKEIQRRLGYPYWVMSWMDMNENLFAALKLEKTAMFVILTLIVLVACFNVVATLLTLVVQKTQEIGILKALGASRRSVWGLFTRAGLLIGAAGTALGAAGGVGLSTLLAAYPIIQLPPEIYYIDRMPVKLEWADVLAVTGAALVLSWAACLYPAWMASRLDPARALRYE